MQDMPDEATVQQVACRPYTSLVGSSQQFERILNCDGVSAIKKSIVLHPWHAGVQYWGNNVLAIMKSESEHAKAQKGLRAGNESPFIPRVPKLNRTKLPKPKTREEVQDPNKPCTNDKMRESEERKPKSKENTRPTSVMMVTLDGATSEEKSKAV